MRDVFAPVLPLRTVASTTLFDHSRDGWTLLESGTDQARRFLAEVRFLQPFTQPPVVHAGLSGFDIENADAARVRVRVAKVRAESFDIAIETWFETKIWSVEVAWLAIGH